MSEWRTLGMRPGAAVAIVALLSLAGAASFVFWGLRLAESSHATWVDRGRQEAVELSAAVDNSLLQIAAQLRALATLFYSSERVDAAELARAEADLPVDGLSLTLSGLAYATAVDESDRASVEHRIGAGMSFPGAQDRAALWSSTHFPITLPSTRSSLFHIGADLTAETSLRSMALTATRHPESVIMSPAFDYDGRWLAAFAIAGPNGAETGLLIGLLDLDDLFRRTVQWAPPGLALQLVQAPSSWEVGGEPILVYSDYDTGLNPVATAIHRFTHGEARWELRWHVLPTYRGGVDLVPAWLAGAGGSVISLLIGLALGMLLYQNALIRRRVEERTAELQVALVQAEQGNKAKTNFLAVVGHELRTPLNAVIGFSELLEASQPTQTGRDYMRFVLTGGRHLLRLVNDLLEVAHAEAGELRLNEGTVDLRALVEETAEMVAPLLDQSDVRLRLDVPSDMPPLRGDPERLRLIVLNLLLNAVRAASPRGEVTIDAEVRSEDGGLSFRVADTGPGMTESQVTASLKLFEQVEGPMNRRHEGLGIGLPLCRHLTDLHGGTLTIATGPGRGTTVSVDLPAARTLELTREAEPVRLQAP